jgi:hypothetical protein
MSFDVHVTLMNDISMGVLTHKVWLPPQIPAPTPSLSIETLISTRHLPGFLMNKNKLTTTVYFNDKTFMLDGHDHGVFIQDLTPLVPANAWYAIMWPFSSRKCAFSAGRVLANELAIGGAQVQPMPLPYVTCGEPMSLPSANALFTFMNNLVVGFEVADVVAGWASIGAAIVIDLLAERLSPSPEPANLRDAINTEILTRLAGFSGRAGAVKLLVGSVVEGVISASRARALGTGEWGVKVSVGSPYFGVEVSYAESNDPTRRGASVQGTYGPRQVTWNLGKRETTVQNGGYASAPVPWSPPPAPAAARPAPQGPCIAPRRAPAAGGAR